MGLHFWLIPLLAVVIVGLLAFFYAIKFSGGTGVRTLGRTVVEKPVQDADDEPRSHSE